MNKRPAYYLQTDARWKDLRLSCEGGTMSLGGGGCGPASAAMLIETITGKTCPPTETFRWCCEHGYMYANQGTSYSPRDYFVDQLARYGISCGRIRDACMSVTSPVRTQVEKMLREGCYFIALMKRGLWTKNGHYIVVWGEDGTVRINDPASTSAPRLNGDPDAFWSTAKYFWWVDARAFNRKEEDEDMKRFDTMAEIRAYSEDAARAVRKLIAAEALGGTTGKRDADGNPEGLNLSEDMLRAFVVNDRMGLYE